MKDRQYWLCDAVLNALGNEDEGEIARAMYDLVDSIREFSSVELPAHAFNAMASSEQTVTLKNQLVVDPLVWLVLMRLGSLIDPKGREDRSLRLAGRRGQRGPKPRNDHWEIASKIDAAHAAKGRRLPLKNAIGEVAAKEKRKDQTLSKKRQRAKREDAEREWRESQPPPTNAMAAIVPFPRRIKARPD